MEDLSTQCSKDKKTCRHAPKCIWWEEDLTEEEIEKIQKKLDDFVDKKIKEIKNDKGR